MPAHQKAFYEKKKIQMEIELKKQKEEYELKMKKITKKLKRETKKTGGVPEFNPKIGDGITAMEMIKQFKKQNGIVKPTLPKHLKKIKPTIQTRSRSHFNSKTRTPLVKGKTTKSTKGDLIEFGGKSFRSDASSNDSGTP